MEQKLRDTEVEVRRRALKKLKAVPLSPGWKGASLLLGAVAVIAYFTQGYLLLGSRGPGDFLLGTLLFLIAVVLATGVLAAVFHLAKRMPSRYFWLASVSFVLIFLAFIGPVPLMVLVALTITIACSALGALVFRWRTGAYREASLAVKTGVGGLAAALLIFVGIGGYWLLDDGNGSGDAAKPYRLSVVKPADRYPGAMENPAEQGAYPVLTLTYGSKDSYREEFNRPDSLVTEQVDGSAFVDKWSSTRTKTFGFGPERMPLNGTIWYPRGEGPFPLVIAVHGNHTATEYSDPGYAYLGELLASRGYIFVSVDENFLNTSLFDDWFAFSTPEKENPARALLLLEHLKVWDKWTKTEGNPFYGKADMSRIALIGHSRGGEAVALAAALNKLPAYPEDGNIKFDYRFGIRSVISIAGTDGQYKPAGHPTRLQDTNYLALQGAHDMDVSSFDGASQYSRTDFTGSGDYFKASVYIYGANHGQFNTVWGRKDAPGLGNKLYNTAQLMPQEEQLQAGKTLISAFLEATLSGKSEYRTVFQDLGYASNWLPDTMYISNYLDTDTTIIAGFDEDFDLGSTTFPGGQAVGAYLKTWREEKVKMKFAPDLYNSALRLKWDSAEVSGVPTYTIVLPEHGPAADGDSAFVFSMADADDGKKESDSTGLTDLSVQIEDGYGNVASVPLSSGGTLLPMFESNIVKRPFAKAVPTKEPVFQNFSIGMADLRAANPNFQPERLSKISFVFDQTSRGAVLIRDIGIRNP